MTEPADPDAPRPRIAKTETSVDALAEYSPGTRVAGRYVIERLAGAGGMGLVYRARDEELGEPVALKVLRPDLMADPAIVERFRGELKLARQVSHPRVVRIHDIGEHGGARFLTMRWVEGRSLRDLLERDGPLSVERGVAIARQLAAALAAAHDAGIVHRDLKPGNIMIDEAGDAVVTDFGVARSLAADRQTRAGAVVGTPDYLAPEQISGDPVDGRTDLYALGLVLYEMVSGQLPFRGGSHAEILAQRLAGRPRQLSESGVRAPAWLTQVIRRCLERDPARRYPDARSLDADLERAGRGTGRRSVRWWAALLVLPAAAAAWYFWNRAEKSEPSSPPATTASGPPSIAAAEHAMAVIPFFDETGDASLAWTGAGVAEMLSTGLSENPRLRVIDPIRVARTLQDLKLTPAHLEDRSLLELADLWSVDRVVTGSVRRAGERLRLDARLRVVEPGARLGSVPLSADAETVERLFDAVGVLVSRLAAPLGQPPRPETKRPETASLDAARLYQEGRARQLPGDEPAALRHLESAVAKDPEFSSALERLAEIRQGLGYHDQALDAAEKAVTAAREEGSRQQARARARLALLRGRPAEAEKQYAALVERYPYDTEARLDLAAAQSAQGHSARAVETLETVARLDPNDPRAWFQLGRNAILSGDSARASSDYLVRALALFSRLGNRKGEADVRNALGVALQQVGNLPQAMESYTQAIQARAALGDDRGVASTLRNRAMIRSSLGDARQAQRDLERARELFVKVGDRMGQADVANDFGVLYEGRGDFARARSAYESALKLRRGLGDERLLAQSYDNVGYVAYLLGDYDDALVYWRQALDLRRKIGEKNGVVLSEQNLGFLAMAQGRWEEATRLFLSALELARETDFQMAVPISLGNLAALHRLRGRYSASLDTFREALSAADRLGAKPALAEFTIQEALALLELGSVERAGEALARAEALVKETANREQQADLEFLRGEHLRALGKSAEALGAFDRAVALGRESGSAVARLRARIGRGAALSETGGEEAGSALLRQARGEAEALGHAQLTLQALEALARSDLTRGRPEAAEAAARSGLSLATEIDWSGSWRLAALLARCLEARRDGSAAAGSWRKAAEALDGLEKQVPEPLREAFRALPAAREVRTKAGERAA
jgi:tetratricopeptide (TPR) repeat protein